LDQIIPMGMHRSSLDLGSLGVGEVQRMCPFQGA